MALIRMTGPADEPVTRDEMKAHLRVDYDDEDELIDQYVSAARQKLEQRCARAFGEQEWELRQSEFMKSVEIPKPPTTAIVSVSYLDASNVEQTVDDSLYALIEGGDFAASTLLWVGEKPTGLADRPDAARIRFSTGWAVADVPYDIKMAIMLTAASMYELRQDVLLAPTRQEVLPLPDGAVTYIAPYIVPRM